MARAGHPPPLLRRPDGRVRVLDLAGGPAAGHRRLGRLSDDGGGRSCPGSVLALYTDGLIESPGVDIEDALADLGAAARREPGTAAGRAGRRVCVSGASAAAQERIDDVALLSAAGLRPHGGEPTAARWRRAVRPSRRRAGPCPLSTGTLVRGRSVVLDRRRPAAEVGRGPLPTGGRFWVWRRPDVVACATGGASRRRPASPAPRRSLAVPTPATVTSPRLLAAGS